jgi:hypothetical protein
MTWMIVSQSLLLALWAAVYKSDSHPNQFVHVIEVIGILFASGSGFSIAAAQGEIEKLKRNYMDFYPTEEWTKQNRRPNHKRKKPIPRVSVRDDILPELTGTKHFHRMGHIVPTAMPWLLALLWAILGAFSAGLLKT